MTKEKKTRWSRITEDTANEMTPFLLVEGGLFGLAAALCGAGPRLAFFAGVVAFTLCCVAAGAGCYRSALEFCPELRDEKKE